MSSICFCPSERSLSGSHRQGSAHWYMLKQKGDLEAPAFLLEECFVAHGQKLRVMIVGPKQPGTVTTEPPCKPWVVVYQGAKYWACAKAVEREK